MGRFLGSALGAADKGTSPMPEELLAPTDTKLRDMLSTSSDTGCMLAAVSATGVDGGGPPEDPEGPPPPPPPPHEASAATAAERISTVAAWGTLGFIPLSVDDMHERRPTSA